MPADRRYPSGDNAHLGDLSSFNYVVETGPAGLVPLGRPPEAVFVKSVTVGSWAESSGLRAGDEILEVNYVGLQLLDKDSFHEEMQKRPLTLKVRHSSESPSPGPDSSSQASHGSGEPDVSSSAIVLGSFVRMSPDGRIGKVVNVHDDDLPFKVDFLDQASHPDWIAAATLVAIDEREALAWAGEAKPHADPNHTSVEAVRKTGTDDPAPANVTNDAQNHASLHGQTTGKGLADDEHAAEGEAAAEASHPEPFETGHLAADDAATCDEAIPQVCRDLPVEPPASLPSPRRDRSVPAASAPTAGHSAPLESDRFAAGSATSFEEAVAQVCGDLLVEHPALLPVADVHLPAASASTAGSGERPSCPSVDFERCFSPVNEAARSRMEEKPPIAQFAKASSPPLAAVAPAVLLPTAALVQEPHEAVLGMRKPAPRRSRGVPFLGHLVVAALCCLAWWYYRPSAECGKFEDYTTCDDLRFVARVGTEDDCLERCEAKQHQCCDVTGDAGDGASGLRCSGGSHRIWSFAGRAATACHASPA